MNADAFAVGNSAFRLGDVRGVYPEIIDEQFAFQFGLAFVQHFNLQTTPAAVIATGRDMRESSLSLQQALNKGLLKAGINVVDLQMCASEMGSFVACQDNIDATIIVTASHNAPKYNGFKCVLAGGIAVSYNTGLQAIEKILQAQTESRAVPTFSVPPAKAGHKSQYNFQQQFKQLLANKIDSKSLAMGPIALNGLNGTAATIAPALADQYGLDVHWCRMEPGPMPSIGADPTQPELANEMKQFMAQQHFELGVAWDGDCDRCVFFDHEGNLIPTYYMMGLFAEFLLQSNPGAAIVYDTKLCWNMLDVVQQNNGIAIAAETGHAFMRQKMVAHNAIYGGELSAHHYFRDFYHCDSGMFAWLMAIQLLQNSDYCLQELIALRREKYLCTPEISLNLENVDQAFETIERSYRATAISVDHFDGLSIVMPEGWRFSLRKSKTEARVRLNMEAKCSEQQLIDNGETVLKHLQPFKAENGDWLNFLHVQ
ncbi:MAG: hypothetical protein KUG79_14190 [Pseudomonadales bacterium]|nr:hypothetical protein [Pseudomonadales bacterium]